MKALVLGGNGFIGSHLVDMLLARGHQVRVFDKHPEAYRDAHKGVVYVYGSFDNPIDMQGVLEGIDTVFHLISTTVPKTSNDDPGFDVRSNLVPTLALLDAAVKEKVGKVVFLSSGGTVYGDPDNLPVNEDARKEPYCSYGVTKLAIEKYLIYYKHQFGLKSVMLRPSNVYGPRQNPDSIQGAIPVFLGKVKKDADIEIWGDGTVVRDFVYVEDLADAMLKAATTDTNSSIFNIGSGEGHSLKEIIAVIEKVTQKKATVSYKEGRAFDVKKIYLDITRAKGELGWSPATVLEKGVEKTWTFLKTLPA